MEMVAPRMGLGEGMRIGLKGPISSLLALGLSGAGGRLWLWRMLWLECVSPQDADAETRMPEAMALGGAQVPHEWD